MKSLQDWIKEDLPEIKSIPKEQYWEQEFYRDPIRPRFIDSNYFYSPADGTILYQKVVKPDEEIIEIKGANYNLKKLMQNDNFNQECLIIGIFLSQYDVHISRMPYTGKLIYKKLEKLQTKNRPMLQEENDVLQGIVDYSDMEYVMENERFFDIVICSRLNYKYYMILIADKEVDVIAHMTENGKIVLQNERVSSIRFGSQIDLILPLPMPFKYKLLVPNYWHVEAGLDRLIRIN